GPTECGRWPRSCCLDATRAASLCMPAARSSRPTARGCAKPPPDSTKPDSTGLPDTWGAQAPSLAAVARRCDGDRRDRLAGGHPERRKREEARAGGSEAEAETPTEGRRGAAARFQRQ